MECIVTKPFEHGGRITKVGDKITLHPRQAESLRLQGKLKFAPVKSASSAKNKKK